MTHEASDGWLDRKAEVVSLQGEEKAAAEQEEETRWKDGQEDFLGSRELSIPASRPSGWLASDLGHLFT